MSEETKQCPYCGEEILAAARKCRFCNTWLDKPPKDNFVSKFKRLYRKYLDFFVSKDKANCRNITASVIIIIALINIVCTFMNTLSDDSAIRQDVYATQLLFYSLWVVISLLLFDKEK